MKKYIMTKFNWSSNKFECVDWGSAQAVFKQKTFNQKTRTSTAIYHWLPTMGRLHKISPEAYPSPLCNTCKNTIETQGHIFTCGHYAARNQQINALEQIEREAKAKAINTFLIRSLTKGLHTWMHDLPPPRISLKKYTVHILVREAYDTQSLLGWDHAIRGRLSKKWYEAQSLHA